MRSGASSGGVRRALLDEAPGERRGVVLLDGRPEHLLLERDGEADPAPLGARLVARVGAWSGDRAFAVLPAGPDGVLRAGAPRPPEGTAVEVQVVAEAWAGKGPRLRLLGPAEGPPRRLAPPPALLDRLAALAPDAALERGPEAREAADLAEEAACAVEHRFRGGLTVTVEPTRALVAVDVDLAAGEGAGANRIKEANLSALRHAARLLRLKSLGGAAVVDLLGFPDPGLRGLYRAEARRALAPDGPEATAATPDAFGLLVMSRPHAARPTLDRLVGPDGAPTARAAAQRLLRDLERELAADPGVALVAVAPPAVTAELRPWLPALRGRVELREVAQGPRPPHVARA